ncbi:hypothetical protein YC2023_082802 [Brassica napus]
MGLSDIRGLKSLSIATPMHLLFLESTASLKIKRLRYPLIGIHLTTHLDIDDSLVYERGDAKFSASLLSIYEMEISTIPPPNSWYCICYFVNEGDYEITL